MTHLRKGQVEELLGDGIGTSMDHEPGKIQVCKSQKKIKILLVKLQELDVDSWRILTSWNPKHD